MACVRWWCSSAPHPHNKTRRQPEPVRYGAVRCGAAGIKKPLKLRVLKDRLSAAQSAGRSNAGPAVFEILFRRIATVGCIDSNVYIIGRRPGSLRFNCHEIKVRAALRRPAPRPLPLAPETGC